MKKPDEKHITEVIRKLERELTSGVEAKRWKAAADLSEFVESAPETLWPLVLRHGSSEDEDLRAAVATCILEHVLEHHFDQFFPKLEMAIRRGNENLRQTLNLCSRFGQAELPENTAKWDRLVRLQPQSVRKEPKKSRRASSPSGSDRHR